MNFEVKFIRKIFKLSKDVNLSKRAGKCLRKKNLKEFTDQILNSFCTRVIEKNNFLKQNQILFAHG